VKLALVLGLSSEKASCEKGSCHGVGLVPEEHQQTAFDQKRMVSSHEAHFLERTILATVAAYNIPKKLMHSTRRRLISGDRLDREHKKKKLSSIKCGRSFT